MGAVIIDPKGDRGLREAIRGRALSSSKAFIEWSPEGPSVYNPYARGSDTEIADKALAGERFTEPHYLRQAQRYLGHVVRTLRGAGLGVSLASIVEQLDPSALERLARTLPEQAAVATHHSRSTPPISHSVRNRRSACSAVSTASGASKPVDCTSRPSPARTFSLKIGVGARVSPS